MRAALAAVLFTSLANAALAQSAFDRLAIPDQYSSGGSLQSHRWSLLTFDRSGVPWVTGEWNQQLTIGPGDTFSLVSPPFTRVGNRDAVVAPDGTLWIASDLFLWRRDPATHALTSLPVDWLWELEWGSDGYLWGVQQYARPRAVVRIDPVTGGATTFPLAERPLDAVFAGGVFWVMTAVLVFDAYETRLSSAALIRVSPTGQMTRYPVPEAGILAPAADGGVWIVGDGTMHYFDPATGVTIGAPSPVRHTRSAGLPIYGMSYAVAPDGSLWIVHGEGVANVVGTTLTNYAAPKLPGANCNISNWRPSASFAPDGRLWFMEHYYPCCTIGFTGCPGAPGSPSASVLRVNTALLTGGTTHHLGATDIPTVSSAVLLALAAAFAFIAMRILANS